MITANENGILHTLGTVSANIGGVLREMDSVAVNDGGVMRVIHSASVEAATVEGITPLVVAENHLVIVENGEFTLSAPKGARIIVGGSAQFQNGGYVAEYTLESDIKNAQCTLQCGAAQMYQPTTLTINGVTYDSGSTKRIIQSKWGPIGGDGGVRGYDGYDKANGTGAGGGAGACSGTLYAERGRGGNNNNYGNFGGNGGFNNANGQNGASGAGGSGITNAGGGGGGGFSAGGGLPGQYDVGTTIKDASAGSAGAGIIVIEW